MAITKTVNSKISVDAESNKVTYEGLSTDSKPTSEVGENSYFHELDTGKWYYFSAGAWAEMPTGGGGGNTNTVETYTGTMDGLASAIGNILETKYGAFSSQSFDEFLSDIQSGNLSATLTLDFNALVPGSSAVLPIGLSHNSLFLIALTGDMAVVDGEPSVTVAAGCQIGFGGSQVWVDDPFAVMFGTWTDLSPYLTAIPYTLTLYWHEMPSA